MRNRYFKADRLLGIELIGDLADFCYYWQRRKFCKTYKIPMRRVNERNYLYKVGFACWEVNPHNCEGTKQGAYKGRIYYSHKGHINYTDNALKKLAIRLLYKHIKHDN